MREYAAHQASQSDYFNVDGIIFRLWRNRKTKKTLKMLQSLDDHLLKDIGLEREGIRELQLLELNPFGF